MALYFSNFPKVYYSYNDFYQTYVTNISARISFEEKFKNNVSAYYYHRIKEEETPEILAYKLYGNPERHWIILLMNDIIDPFYDWPLSYSTFNNYLISKYGSVEYAMSNNHSYYKVVTNTININSVSKIVNVEKFQVDANTYTDILENPQDYTYESILLKDGNSLSIQVSGESKSLYNYEVEENEKKRNIKILKQEFVSSATTQLKEIFRT